MGYLKQMAKEIRSEISDLTNPREWFLKMLSQGSVQSDTGIDITDENALRVAAVFAAVTIISEDIAVPPLNIYKLDRQGGKEVATEHRLYERLHFEPNQFQNSHEWRSMTQGHVLLRGNAYTVGLPDGSLMPLHPDRVKIQRTNSGIYYEYRNTLSNGEQETKKFLPSEILHLRHFSTDGVYGISPIRACMNVVGLAIATEKHGSRLFSNAARPDGFIRHPKTLSKAAGENLRKDIREKFSGASNSHGLMLLEEDMSWTQIGLKNDEAQFLETRKFQIAEIARMFRLPPHMLSDLEKATFSNIEQQSIDYVTRTLLPWIRRWEMMLNMRLLTEKERKKYRIGFILDAFLRGDTKARYEAYAQGRQWGFLSPNDVREMEDWPLLPPEKGDVYNVPLNFGVLGEKPPEPVAPKADPTPADQGGEVPPPKKPEKKGKDILYPVFKECVQRALKKESLAVEKNEGKTGESRSAWAATFYEKLENDLFENVRPALSSLEEITGKEVDSMQVRAWAAEYCASRRENKEIRTAADLRGSVAAVNLLSDLLRRI